MTDEGLPRVVAIVTAFDPGPRLQEVLAALRPQVEQVLVVDDGSVRREDLAIAAETSEVIAHPANIGIAAALNTGLARAMALGADHVLTVDQDTILDRAYVTRALDALRELADHHVPTAAVGAWTVEPGSPPPHDHERFRECRAAMQSGLLMPVPVIRRLGRYRESLFIDCVETDYLLRARRLGLKTFVVRACVVDHRLGEDDEVRLFGRVMRFPMHSAARRYYITRNRAWLTVRHGGRQPLWTAHQLKDVLRVFVLSVLSPRGGRAHVAAAALGALDFLRGRGGRIPLATRRPRRRRTRARRSRWR